MHDPDTLRERTAGGNPATDPTRPAPTPTPPISDDQPTRVQGEPQTPRTASAERLSFPTVPGYEVLEVLGRGGMGVVFKARQLGLNRLVALKVLPPHGRMTGEEWARFVSEAELLARCAHPNIVQVHHFGTYDGTPYLTLEYVEGGPLSARLKGTPQPPRDTAALIETVARAVHHAHCNGIVHRDLKPANILLQTGEPPAAATPKITDFGLARCTDSGAVLTRTGAIMGTPSYMAPEQALGQGDRIGPAVDVHALGAILYEMLTGRPPFRGASAEQTLELVRGQDALAPRLIVPAVPRDLETICLKCLEKEPECRYGSAQALADDLGRFLRGEPIRARPASSLEKAGRWCRRHPSRAALCAVSVLAVVLPAALGAGFAWHVITAHHELDLAHAEARRREGEVEQTRVRAATHEHYRGLNVMRRRQEQGEPNWRENNMRHAGRLAANLPPDASAAELRTELVAALGATDLGFAREVAPGFDAAALAFSPDGRLLALAQGKAVAYALNGVWLLDPESGRTERKLVFGSDMVWQKDHVRQDGSRSLAFSPDGRWLVVGARSGWLHRWDLRAEPPKYSTWKGHQDEVRRLVFRDDNLYSSAADGTVKRWDWSQDWQEKACFTGKGCYADMVVSPAGWVGVVGDGRLTILDCPNLVPRPKTLAVRCDRLALAHDGRTLYLCDNGGPVVVDAQQMKVLHRARPADDEDGPAPRISGLRLSQDGGLLAISIESTGHVELWDTASLCRITRLHVGEGWLRLAFQPNGCLLAVAVEHKTLLYPIKGREIQSAAALHPRRLYDVGWGPQGLFAYAGRAEGGSELTYWPCADRRLHAQPARRWALPACGDCPSPLAVHPQGTGAAVRVNSHRVEWRGDGAAEEVGLEMDNPHALQFDPEGHLWTAAGSEVQSRAVPEGRVLAKWSNGVTALVTGIGETHSLACGYTFTLAGGREGLLRRIDTAGKLEDAWPVAHESLNSVTLSPDAVLAAVGTAHGELVVVRAAAGTVLARQLAHEDAIDSAVWLAPDLLVTSSRDGSARFWRVRHAEERVELEDLFTARFSGPVRRVSLSADGRTLAVCVQGERGARLWNLECLAEWLEKLHLGVGPLTPREQPPGR